MPPGSDGPALLREVVDNPHDDGVLLVFADWLEEAGDPAWAGFIRAGVYRGLPGALSSDVQQPTAPLAESNPLTLEVKSALATAQMGDKVLVTTTGSRLTFGI